MSRAFITAAMSKHAFFVPPPAFRSATHAAAAPIASGAAPQAALCFRLTQVALPAVAVASFVARRSSRKAGHGIGSVRVSSVVARNATEAEEEAPAVPAEGTPEEALCKLDIRCGLIESCEKVEDSDKLFVLKVNIGDEEPRQVITGLQKFYETEELSNRKVVVYCNIKPAKLAGLASEAMVLASSMSKGEDDVVVEVLSPPEGVEVGTRAMCGEYEVGCLSAKQNPKKISKVWSKVAPLLVTDENCEVTYDGTTLLMDGKPITSKSVAKGQVS